MKTAISLPNPLFELAEALAKRLKLSRSRLYARAIEQFVNDNRFTEIVKTLNEVYAKESSHLDPEISNLQHQTLKKELW